MYLIRRRVLDGRFIRRGDRRGCIEWIHGAVFEAAASLPVISRCTFNAKLFLEALEKNRKR